MQAGQQGDAPAFRLAGEYVERVPGEHRVHGRHRFVGEQDFRLLVQGAGDADPLQLAAGQLVAALEQLVGEIQALQCGPGAGDIDRIDQAGQTFPQRPLTETPGQHGGHHPLPGWQGRCLVNQPDARAQALACPAAKRPRLVAEQLVGAGGRHQVGGENAQQGGLAGTGRADDGDALAGFDAQVDPGDCLLAVGVDELHAGQTQGHFNRPAARADSSIPL
ncbi:hypothetical protein D9M71_466040 [compost metagenome]